MSKRAVSIMCKDEEKNILRTLNSILNFVEILFVYDTGSTDRTVSIIKEWVDKNSIPLIFKRGEFVDFSTSRNVLLKLIDDNAKEYDVGYFLMMDVNEELQGADELIAKWPELTLSCYNVDQKWNEIDGGEYGMQSDYYTLRLIKPNCGWYYKRKIHEILYNDKMEQWLQDGTWKCDKTGSDVCLFQDRHHDNEKSERRFKSDLKILLQSFIKEKDNPNRDENDFRRDIYFIAQTYMCIARIPGENKKKCYKNALKYFLLRGELDSPFKEETFNALLYAGYVSFELEMPWDYTQSLYLKAYNVCPTRVEPLISMASDSYCKKNYVTAFMFINHACRFEYPNNLSMVVNRMNWEYLRWKIMALVCLELGKTNRDMFMAGKEAFSIAYLNAKKMGREDPKDLDLLNMFNGIEQQVNETLGIKDTNSTLKSV